MNATYGCAITARWLDLVRVLYRATGERRHPRQRGGLTFGEPGVRTTPPLGSEYSLRPQVGILVLFPSYFRHGTVPFRSEQARLSVAFDAVPD